MSAPEKAPEPKTPRASPNRAQVLLEINNAIASHLELAPLLKAISECLRRELPHDFAGLAIYDSEVGQLRLHGLNFEAGREHFSVGQLVPIEGTPGGLAFTSRRPVLRHHPDPTEFPAERMRAALEAGVKSGCVVPLISHGNALGTLAIASLRESAFTEADAELLSQIAAQVAIAVENALNYEKLHTAEREVAKERDRSRLLLEVNNAVVTHLNLSDLLTAVSARLNGFLPHDSTFIALRQPDGIHLQTKAQFLGKLQNVKFTEGLLVPMEGTPEERVIQTGKPVLVASASELGSFPSPWVRHALDVGIKSGCSVPLMFHGDTLGVLGITSLQERAFKQEEVTLLEQCATQIAIAVQNALNFENAHQAGQKLRQERDRSQLLLDINNAVVSQLDLKELLKSTSASLHRIVPHDVALLALCDSTGTQLRVHALDVHEPLKGPLGEGVLFPVEGTPEGEAVRSGHPVMIKTRADIGRFSPLTIQNATAYGVGSGCTVPLMAHGRTLGSLTIVSFEEGAFTEEDAKLLDQCSRQIAIAVQNALNFENARAAEQQVTRERDRLQLLMEMNNHLVSNLNLRELLKATAASVRRIMHCDLVSVHLPNAEGTRLQTYALDFPDGRWVEHETETGSAVKGTLHGKVFETGKPIVAAELDAHEYPQEVAFLAQEGIAGGCVIPMIHRGRVMGNLGLGRREKIAYTQEDVDFLMQFGTQVAIAIENARAYGQVNDQKEQLAQEKLYLEDEIRAEFNFDEIIGQSPALRKVLQMVETVANSDSTVLLLGETGTGKELIARAVHNHSRRKQRTFVKLNCAAIPTGLLESELFGHEKGAFTGAISQKIGRLELADQGTLFLDEVGDIPVEIQPKLLRALQEREFERLGSTHTKKVNVRLVAATNRDLEKMIAAREFRSDLYYRLNVFPIRIPPLRDRPEDILLLVRYFAEKFSRQMQKSIESIPAEAMAKLRAWRWPGNIRELENLIERSVILTTGSALQVPLAELGQPQTNGSPVSPPTTLEGTEREHIIKILRETRGVLAGPNGAASRLGLKRTTLQYKIKKLGIARHHWWPAASA